MPRTRLSAAERQRQLDQRLAAGVSPPGLASASDPAIPVVPDTLVENDQEEDDQDFVVVRCDRHQQVGGALVTTGQAFWVQFLDGAARVHPDVARHLEQLPDYTVEWSDESAVGAP